MKKLETKDLVIIASLAALGAVLRFVSIPITGTNKIVFHNIPIMIASFSFGPIIGVLTGIIVDVTSLFYQPGWHPLYTLAYVMWGLVPGVLKYVFNFRKVGGLLIIETIAHLLASASNKAAIWILWGYKSAFGPISIEHFIFLIHWGNNLEFIPKLITDFNYNLPVLKNVLGLFAINGVIYVGIALTLVMMIIKIPIDVIILKVLNQRVVDPLILKNDIIE